jgi:hypothetical protein
MMDRVRTLIVLTMIGSFFFAILYPPIYAWSILDDPMVVPEAKGMTLREFYQDRRAAYVEAWEKYGVEKPAAKGAINIIVTNFMYGFGEWVLGNPVCGSTDPFLFGLYSMTEIVSRTYNRYQAEELPVTQIVGVWQEEFQRGIWFIFTLPPNGLTPKVCRFRPVIYPEQIATGN